jgi:hypothetical protein
MDRDSMERLKLDRRLIGRRNWISPEDLSRALEGLPDASHKIAQSDAAEPVGGEASHGAGSTESTAVR